MAQRGPCHDRRDGHGPARPSARPHRLAGAGRRQQRQLAHGVALAALPGAGGERRDRPRLDGRGLRCADRAARPALGRRDRPLPRRAAGRAPGAGADRHRPVSRHRGERPGCAAFAGVCQRPGGAAGGGACPAGPSGAGQGAGDRAVGAGAAGRAPPGRRRLRRRRPPARGEGPAHPDERRAPLAEDSGAGRPPTIVHLGGALDDRLAAAARATMAACPAYRWLGAAEPRRRAADRSRARGRSST